jgi:NADPH:quinone reductase
MTDIPNHMLAAVLHRYDLSEPDLRIEEIPVPVPGLSQVLIRVEASPINPADIMFTRGLYPTGKELPTVAGFEGAGTVVAAGEQAADLVGKRVGFFAGRHGAWAAYTAVDRTSCFPLPDHVSVEQGAMLLINPISAIGLLQTAQEQGAKAVIQTAAASALGRMIVRLAQRQGVPTINIVRRAEQAALLRGLGAGHVLDSSQPGWQEELARLAAELSATVAFDAVAGAMTGQVLDAMPNGSTVYVYGALSLEPCQVNPGNFVFQDKRVDGFWLSQWLPRHGHKAPWQTELFALIGTDLSSTVVERVGLQNLLPAMSRYQQQMTRGKFLVAP